MSGVHQLLTLLSVLVIAGVGNALPQERIIGGTEAALGEFPYQAALRIRGSHLCGGAIIGERHIITAAHCVVGVVKPPYYDFRVATGTVRRTGGLTRAVKSVVSHSKYNAHAGANSANDIAIIELLDKINFDKNQDKIDLPTNKTSSGVDVIATGWGYVDVKQRKTSETLMKVTLKTLDPTDCKKYAPSFNLNSHQICSTAPPGRGVCQGDSGGPLANKNELVGLVSYGVPCARGIPDVYTSVYHYLDWIKKTMGSS